MATDTASQVDHRTSADLAVGVFAGALVALLAAAYVAARLEFEIPTAAVFRAVTIAVFLVSAASGAAALRVGGVGGQWLRWGAAEATLAALSSVVLAGLATAWTGLDLFWLFPPLAIGLAGATWVRWFRGVTVPTALALVGIAAILSAWLAGTVWGSGYADPLFLEKLIFRHSANRDTLYHSTIAMSFLTYGTPSSSLDGTPYLPYHYGSHWIFAQMARLIRVPTVVFYQLGYPIIILPFSILCLLVLAQRARRVLWPGATGAVERSLLFWSLLVFGAADVLPLSVSDRMIHWNTMVISESFVVAMSLSFLLVASSLALYAAHRDQDGLTNVQWWLAFGAIPIGILALGFVKISVLAVLCSVYFYLFLRLGWFRSKRNWPTLALLVIGALLINRATSQTEALDGIRPFAFLRSYVSPKLWPMWMILYPIFTLAFVATRLGLSWGTPLVALKKRVRQRDFLDVEVLLVACVAGIVPGLILNIAGGSAAYFSDVQQPYAAALLMAMAPELEMRLRRLQRTRMALALGVAAAALYLSAGANVGRAVLRAVNENTATRAAAAEQHASGANTPESRLVQMLLATARLPDAERAQSLLWIPRSNETFWRILPNCAVVPFVGPALSGMAMVDGLPERGCKARYYGYSLYDPTSRHDPTSRPNLEAVCRRARAQGFARVIAIPGDIGPNPKATAQSC